ncbi:MAG: flagellar biosynthesis protein, partial [Gemmobacter sp.]
ELSAPKSDRLFQIIRRRTNSYEAGYKAGWEDASAAHAAGQAELRADVARNLQAMSFTYHEARGQILRAIEPLLTDIAARLLPEVSRAVLPAQISAVLLPLAEQATEVPVTLVIHPDARADVEAFASLPSGLPIAIHETDALGPGQATLRLGEVETRIDMDGAVAAIAVLIRDFFDLPRKERRHG